MSVTQVFLYLWMFGAVLAVAVFGIAYVSKTREVERRLKALELTNKEEADRLREQEKAGLGIIVPSRDGLVLQRD
jgi:cytochrome c-type biogenesis protein CcmH/NrfF